MRSLTRFPLVLLGLAALIAIFAAPIQAMVAGIDIGNDYFKIAIVKPRQPFQIVTNVHTKRKTNTMVAFDRDVRLFGGDAAEFMVRRPEQSFSQILRFLGRNASHASVQHMKENEYYPWVIEEDTDRHSIRVAYKFSDTVKGFSVEELAAMVFTHAKEITDAFSGSPIKDCVITVPSHWTQAEKVALIDSAELGGFSVLSLIDENTAAALQLALGMNMEESPAPKKYLFYNMGASRLQVSIVEYFPKTIKEAGKNKTVVGFDVKAKAWDASLGGQSFDFCITELLADEVNKLSGATANSAKDIRRNLRAMAKVKKAALHTKSVLSTLQSVPVNIASIVDDRDLSIQLSRQKFESACVPLFARVLDPVKRALDEAALTVSDIDTIEIIGGGVRIPKIQNLLKDYLKDKELASHLNGDEAMAMGAAFHASNLSSAFRVRHVAMTDVTPFGVNIRLFNKPVDSSNEALTTYLADEKEAEKASADSGFWSKSATLFQKDSKLNAKKIVAFQHDKDILLDVNYEVCEEFPVGLDHKIVSYTVSGVESFVKDLQAKPGLAEAIPKVQLNFLMDSSGLISLPKAEAIYEETLPVVEEEKPAAAEEEKGQDTGTTEGDSNSTPTNSTVKASATEKEKKPKKKTHRQVLKISSVADRLAVKPMDQKAKKESFAKLSEINRNDAIRKAKEKAKNDLEATMYHIRGKFSSNEEEFAKVSTDEQRQEIVTEIDTLEDWLYDEGENETAEEYGKRLKSLKSKFDAIVHRSNELTKRPRIVSKAQDFIKKTRTEVEEKWEKNKPQVTEDERKDLLTQLTTFEEWLNEQLKAQEAKAAHEEPAFVSSQVSSRQKTIKSLYTRLDKRPLPTPKPTPAPTPAPTTKGEGEEKEAKPAEAQPTEAEDKEETKPEEGVETPKTPVVEDEEL